MPFPEREEDKKDFLYQLLYKFNKQQVEAAFVSMVGNPVSNPKIVGNLKEYVPQISEDAIKLAFSVHHDRDAMLTMMLLVLVMDDTNGFTQYARQNAYPRARFEFFRQWFAHLADSFLKIKLSDAHVPSPDRLLSAARSEYCRRRDNQSEWRKFFREYVPRDDRRSAGT